MRSQCMRQSDKTLPHRCAWSPYLQYLTRKRTICKGPDVSTISNYQSVHLPRCKMLSIISVTWARGWLCIACGHKVTGLLTLNPLTWKIWRAPNNARIWQMGFNSAFKGLKMTVRILTTRLATSFSRCNPMWFLSMGLRQGSGLCSSSSSRKYPGTEGTNQNRRWNHHRWHATDSLERTRLSCWCL